MKPFVFNVDHTNLTDYQKFILDECKVDWNYRISYVDFFSHFVEWKRTKNPNYTLDFKYKKQIQSYLEEKFAGGRVHLSDNTKSTHLFGVWGLGMAFNNFGLKVPEKTSKKVAKYNATTNTLIHMWESLSIASRELNIPLSTLSNYCRFETTVDDVFYKYYN